MDHFVILTRVEFISLINYLELNGIPTKRVVKFNEKSIINTLLEIPSSDFEEDYMIVKCTLYDDDDKIDTCSLRIDQIKEIIPFSNNSFLSYKRKFPKCLIWTDPSKYELERIYNGFLAKKMHRDSINNYELTKKFILKEAGQNLIHHEVLEEIIQAKIDKQLKGKKDTEIEKNQYQHVFQSLLIYEQGSHFPRESVFGFLLHGIGVYMLHEGIGQKLVSKIKLSTRPTIIKLKEINNINKFDSFNDIFSNSELKSVIESFLSKTAQPNIFEDLKTISYFLFYKFLLSEKDISFRNIYLIVKELNGNLDLTLEEKKALLLLAIDCSTPKIAEDIMVANQNILIVNREISQSHSIYELISRYYKPAKKEVAHKISLSKKQTIEPISNVILEPISEIIKNLPSDVVTMSDKEKYFENEILAKFRDDLEKAGYDLSTSKNKKKLFSQIFPKPKRR
jgi:hypothetical protein